MTRGIFIYSHCLRMNPQSTHVRAHLSFCSADIPVCGFPGHSCPVSLTGDWKVGGSATGDQTRRLESLRYALHFIVLLIMAICCCLSGLDIQAQDVGSIR